MTDVPVVESADLRIARLEQELQRLRQEHRGIVTTFPHGWAYHRIVVDDKGLPCDYEFLDVNAEFEKLTGLRAADILGRRATEIFPSIRQQDPDLVSVYGKVALEGGESFLETFFEPLGRWYRITTRSPSPGTFVCIFDDVTRAKLAEGDEQLFFNVVLDLLCITGFDTRFRKVSPSWASTLGWSAQEMLDHSFMDFVHPDDRAATLAAASTLADGRNVVDFKNRFRCKDGSYRWLSWRSFSLPVRQIILAAARDITTQQQLEDELRTHQELLTAQVEQRSAELRVTQERLLAHAQEIMELSTPVMKVWEGVVVAPLIGTLDSQRTQRFMERLLTAIVDHKADIALIDVTGVPLIDSVTAQNLLETTSAVRLLGARVVITGIRPAIAQTLIHLGIKLGDLVTRSSLEAGVRYAIETRGPGPRV